MRQIENLELKNERVQKLHDVFTSINEQRITPFKHKEYIKTGLYFFKEKGGVVVTGQTVVIKSNFELSGLRKKDGTQPSKKSIGMHTAKALEYMNNHGNDDIKADSELSNIYNEDGERIGRSEFNQLQTKLENDGLNSMRRTMISIGHSICREEYVTLIKDSIDTLKDLTDKNFEYKFAIHTDHDLPHAHVIAYSNNGKNILLNKDQIQLLKEIVADKAETLFVSKELDKSIEKDLEKTIQGGMELWKVQYG